MKPFLTTYLTAPRLQGATELPTQIICALFDNFATLHLLFINSSIHVLRLPDLKTIMLISLQFLSALERLLLRGSDHKHVLVEKLI